MSLQFQREENGHQYNYHEDNDRRYNDYEEEYDDDEYSHVEEVYNDDTERSHINHEAACADNDQREKKRGIGEWFSTIGTVFIVLVMAGIVSTMVYIAMNHFSNAGGSTEIISSTEGGGGTVSGTGSDVAISTSGSSKDKSFGASPIVSPLFSAPASPPIELKDPLSSLQFAVLTDLPTTVPTIAKPTKKPATRPVSRPVTNPDPVPTDSPTQYPSTSVPTKALPQEVNNPSPTTRQPSSPRPTRRKTTNASTYPPTNPPTDFEKALPTSQPTTFIKYAMTQILSQITSITTLEDDTTPQYAALQFLLNDTEMEAETEDDILQRYVIATLFYSAALRQEEIQQSIATNDNGERDLQSSNDDNQYDDFLNTPPVVLDNIIKDNGNSNGNNNNNNGNGNSNNNNGNENNNNGNTNNGNGNDNGNGSSNQQQQKPPRPPALDQFVKPTMHECDWLPVYVNCTTTDTKRRVQLLRLDGEQYPVLEGTLPSEIGYLTDLEYLELKDNLLTGTIPSTIGSLNKLKYLDISRNQLGGKIPNQLYKLKKLNDLHLWGNSLSGSLSSKIGQLKELEYLSLDENELTGRLPTGMGKLTNMDW
eukprot:CAMPEP_0194387444 /NCGR_PEP_ID=MMETSP0174-20130528/92377_1 /TAXON_ID=216777 /ORGANISM="Proboscia alata, Strain PI-D3" /LENGTH=591 /DNA_ID=CAMNT_0039177639 /DNA_START=78 /DNA_END=1850 /DNA_ORIENTATION=+